MTEIAETRPVGRPTEYDPAYCEKVLDLGKAGKSKAQMAAALGVTRQTLDNWTAAHPEFLDAVKAARELALAWWEDQGQDGLTADKFNATAFIFQMKNRFRDDYADRQAHELTGKDGEAIRHSHAFDLTDATDEELAALERFITRRAADAGGDQGGKGEEEG